MTDQVRQAVLLQLHDRIENDFGFHPATPTTRVLHEQVRANFAFLAHWIADNVPVSRAQSLALTHLQEAAMWSNAAVACTLAPLEPINHDALTPWTRPDGTDFRDPK